MRNCGSTVSVLLHGSCHGAEIAEQIIGNVFPLAACMCESADYDMVAAVKWNHNLPDHCSPSAHTTAQVRRPSPWPDEGRILNFRSNAACGCSNVSHTLLHSLTTSVEPFFDSTQKLHTSYACLSQCNSQNCPYILACRLDIMLTTCSRGTTAFWRIFTFLVQLSTFTEFRHLGQWLRPGIVY